MTYARARLGLGVAGVGSLVLIASLALLFDIPQLYFSNGGSGVRGELAKLATVVGLFMLWLMPLDFLGGYYLPKKFRKTDGSFLRWFSSYFTAAILQAALFVFFGSMIMLVGGMFGGMGVMVAVGLGIVGCFVFRNQLLLKRKSKSGQSSDRLVDAIAMIQVWQIFVPRTIVVQHRDIGFSGGIVGFGKYAKIIIPEAWLEFPKEELATAIARRAIAIESGSYTRGLIFSLAWNVLGFLLCSTIPGAGFTSTAELVTTVCGFTLWSFVGLLTLPTVSRNASLKIDQTLVKKGMPRAFISHTAKSMDVMQDDEPERTAFIETIFHPVPNVSSRNFRQPIRGLDAWNVARTTLFFSWACLGFLSRAVHCNIGRPELWTMLPTD